MSAHVCGECGEEIDFPLLFCDRCLENGAWERAEARMEAARKATADATKTVTLYAVARTPEDALRMVIDEEWQQLGIGALFTLAAARGYRDGIVGKDELHIYPVQLTAKVGEPLP